VHNTAVCDTPVLVQGAVHALAVAEPLEEPMYKYALSCVHALQIERAKNSPSDQRTMYKSEACHLKHEQSFCVTLKA
jgi:hypothetical protein